MKIIILAAGKGERLMPLTKNTPKSLIDMGNGNTLLEEQIKSISDSQSINEIVLVLGYLAEQVEAKIKYHLQKGLKIKTVFNPFYETSNNLISLWFARYEMDDNFLITNGDNLFTSDVFASLVNSNEDGIFLSVSKKHKYDEDDMKVIIENGIIVEVSKKIPLEKVNAESPGLAMVKGKRSQNIFVEHLDALVRNKSYINSFWLEIFNRLYKKGIPVIPWYFDGNTKWEEVDFHFDVEKVRELVYSKHQKIFGSSTNKKNKQGHE